MKFIIQALVVGIAAAATCTYTVSTYATTDCTGTETKVEYSNLPVGIAAATTKIAVTDYGDLYYRVTSCFPTKAISYAWYSDEEGKTGAGAGGSAMFGAGGWWVGEEAGKCF